MRPAPLLPRLKALWDDITGSLWALPLVMMAAGGALALTSLYVRIEWIAEDAWWLYSGSARNAPDFLANLLSSMITMGTLAISITMVVLTLAAQQLGPRLIMSFMGDLRTQAALGLFLATIVYLLLVLRALSGELGEAGVPNLAVTIGTGLVLVSVVTLVFFVHHLGRSIVADHVIDRVGDALDAATQAELAERDHAKQPGPRPSEAPEAAALRLVMGGYIQIIDYDALVETAAQAGVTVELAYRAGHHILPGGVHGWVTPGTALNDGLAGALAGSILIGGERTPGQDLEFAVRQLVEVALRALSPGVSDPFTAIAAIDRLALSLAAIMRGGSVQTAWADGSGTVRVIAPASDFQGIADTAFNQIRQIARTDAAVLIHLADKLGHLAELASSEQAPIIAKHVDLVRRAGEAGIPEPRDFAVLERHARRATANLDRGRRCRTEGACKES